jgi:hypothetical protein
MYVCMFIDCCEKDTHVHTQINSRELPTREIETPKSLVLFDFFF